MRLVQRRNFAAAGLTCHVPARKLNATTAKALPDIRRRLFCCISAVEKRKKLRRGHYVFIRRHHLGAAGRGAGILHAGGLCDGGDRPDTRQKCGQHHHEKPDGFCPRHRCLLAGRLRHHVRGGRRVDRRVRPVHPGRLQQHVPVLGVRHFSNGVLRHGGHHRLRRDGGAHQVPFLLHLQRSHKPDRLPCRRALGLGRRLAEPAGLPRLCGQHGSAYGGRPVRAHRRKDGGAAHRQIYEGRQGERHPGPQPYIGRAGLLYPVVLLVRLQRLLHRFDDGGRDIGERQPHLRQYQPGRSCGNLCGDDHYLEPLQKARRLDDAERFSGRTCGHHGRLRRSGPVRRGHYRADRGLRSGVRR